MSVQCVAVASQKLTWPVVTGFPASVTLAVKVTTLPAFTVVTAPPADFTASLVVVALFAHAGTVAPHTDIRTAQSVIARGLGLSMVAWMRGKKLREKPDRKCMCGYPRADWFLHLHRRDFSKNL
jgi:hypothetical protein